MQAKQLERYHEILITKKAELRNGRRHRDELVIEQTSDALDEVQLAREREFATLSLDREAALLRAVELALARIADGSYGSCMDCGDEINLKRLNAVPWTPYCMTCQQSMEQQEAQEVSAAAY